MPSSCLQHALSATSETLGSITYYNATRVRISNSHFSDDFGDVDQSIIAASDPLQEFVASSQSFSKAAVEHSTSEKYDLMDFDNEVAESIAHLDASPYLSHSQSRFFIPRSLVWYITASFCSYCV